MMTHFFILALFESIFQYTHRPEITREKGIEIAIFRGLLVKKGMKTYDTHTLAYSSCPNDTFIFKAIARQLIPVAPFDFKISMADVETLNQEAARETHDITKLSFAALGRLLDTYALLRTGSALGRGCGPLLISRPHQDLASAGLRPVVAVPGLGTTAYFLFRFYLADQFPDLSPEILPMPFEQIMPAVAQGRAHAGVIIHEGRFVYADQGMALCRDLGEWWEEKTGHPIPLGCIAVKRSLGADIGLGVERLIGESIDHAFAHPRAGADYIREHAQEMEEAVLQKHISLYVNQYSRELGKEGEAAVRAFFDYAVEAGLMAPVSLPLFVG